MLLVDPEIGSACATAALLTPEAQVIHAPAVADAARLLASQSFAPAMLAPTLPEGDSAALLLPLCATSVMVHARRELAWPMRADPFLPKPWTSSRAMWTALSRMPSVPTDMAAGD